MLAIHTVEYYLTTERDEILTNVLTQVNLDMKGIGLQRLHVEWLHYMKGPEEVVVVGCRDQAGMDGK